MIITCAVLEAYSPLPLQGRCCRCRDNYQHLKPTVEAAYQSYGKGGKSDVERDSVK